MFKYIYLLSGVGLVVLGAILSLYAVTEVATSAVIALIFFGVLFIIGVGLAAEFA